MDSDPGYPALPPPPENLFPQKAASEIDHVARIGPAAATRLSSAFDHLRLAINNISKFATKASPAPRYSTLLPRTHNDSSPTPSKSSGALQSFSHLQSDIADYRKAAGGIGKGATGILFVDGKQVAQGQVFPRRDFDVGEDTGTPVVEDYNDKMPFAFTGTLKKLVVVLEPDKLTEEERKRLLEEEAKASMAVQ